MTAVRRLLRHYLLGKPHSPRHAKPATAPSNPAAYRRPYDPPNGSAA